MQKVRKRVPAEARIVGANVRNLRKHAGLTQKQLADVLGITFQQVQKYERGENRFPLEKLHLMKNHFNVPYHVFFIGLDGATETRPWPDGLCARLKTIREAMLQDKIERVVAILME